MIDDFSDSRRLLGPNPYFAETGAILNAVAPAGHDPHVLAAWRRLVGELRQALNWPDGPLVDRRHAKGSMLALAAPLDQLQTACDVNELAWQMASDPCSHSLAEATRLCLESSSEERDPALLELMRHANSHRLPVIVTDDEVSIGIGDKSRCWPRSALPVLAEIPWSELADAPIIVVTGTNGKTTTVRLCAAIAKSAGFHPGYNSTEGVIIDGIAEIGGDYAGPAGAFRVLKNGSINFAVLEAARGGILRRGLALDRAKVAVVTNIAADHFGEYGVDTIADLITTKLAVARLIASDGLLVLNGEIPALLEHARAFGVPIALFALDHDHPALIAHRAAQGRTCGVERGRLILSDGGIAHDLGAIVDMPLTLQGRAIFNIANIAAASLASHGCGIAAPAIAQCLGQFGATPSDNPGRLEYWCWGGRTALLDYAHNPAGLSGLLDLAGQLRGAGRLGLTCGQAGNRSDDDIRHLAETALAARPDLILLKDEPGFLRGRAPGEVPELMRQTLLRGGMAENKVLILPDELDAAAALLAWTLPGDIAVLSVHGNDSRPRLRAILELLGKTQ